MLFLSGLQDDEIVKTMHILLGYIQSSPPEQRPLVAVLLLHLELLVYSLNIYLIICILRLSSQTMTPIFPSSLIIMPFFGLHPAG